MNAFLVLIAMAGQFADAPEFPRPLQTKALEATVRVFQMAHKGEGSGIVIAHERGSAYILTAAHIVPAAPNGDDVDVTFFPLGKRPIEMKGMVMDRMTNEDLAIIVVRTNRDLPSVTPLCPKAGAPPMSLDKSLPVLTTGMGPLATPEAVADQIRAHKLMTKPGGEKAFHWEADKPQAVGRSGGGLYDSDGRLIGICSGTKGNKGYYVSVYEIRSSLKKKAFGFLAN